MLFRGCLRLQLRANLVFASFSRTYALHRSILEELNHVIGEKAVATTDAVRSQHGQDEGPYQPSLPDAVVFPKTTEHVSNIAEICNKHEIPIIPFGTGTGLEGGINALKGGICLDLSQMDQITSFSPEDFNVTVQPGITRIALNNYLKSSGLWFPVDPGADASLCGMVATGASGTNAVRYGTMRENVLNLEVVLADGTCIHTCGKDRCTRKTSAGYNLTNLFVGSEGTLGIITSATLKLFGLPEVMLAGVCTFPTVKDAITTTQEILQTNIPIARIEFLDDISVAACNKYSKTSYEETSTLFLEFHGNSAEVESQATTAGEIITSNNGSNFTVAKETNERNRLWKARHTLFYATLGLKSGSKAVITDVCVPISRLPEMITAAKRDIADAGLIGPVLGHVGDGNFHSILLFDPNNAEEYAKAKSVSVKIAKQALRLEGTCTGEHGIGQGKIQLLAEEVGPHTLSLMKSIKKLLDPKSLLNPGKIFAS